MTAIEKWCKVTLAFKRKIFVITNFLELFLKPVHWFFLKLYLMKGVKNWVKVILKEESYVENG